MKRGGGERLLPLTASLAHYDAARLLSILAFAACMLFQPSLAMSQAGEPRAREAPHVKTPTCRVVYFLHIPKTGGTSTHLALIDEAKRRPDFLHVLPRQYPTKEKLYSLVYQGLKSRRYRVAVINSHHRSPPLMTFLPTLLDLRDDVAKIGCDFYFFTELRDPWSRITSAIAYNDISDISSYLKLVPNIQPNYVIYNHPSLWPREQMSEETTRHESLRILSHFDYVTPMEDPLGFEVFAECVGFLQKKKRHENVTRRKKKPLTEEQRVQFENLNRVEIDMYFHYATLKHKIKQDMPRCPPLSK